MAPCIGGETLLKGLVTYSRVNAGAAHKLIGVTLKDNKVMVWKVTTDKVPCLTVIHGQAHHHIRNAYRVGCMHSCTLAL